MAALKDGGFVVAWRSDGQDLSGAGVYAQRYDASGVRVGNEFRVSTSTSSNQYQPTIAGLENGGWVVSWYDDGLGDVMMQQYDSGGRQIDGQTRVNTYRFSTQYQPAVVSMPDGGFVVAYSGYISASDGDGDGLPDGGNNTYEIRLQRYSNTAPILTDVTANGLEDTPIVLTDELFISGCGDVINGLSLGLVRGELTAVIGPNGAGKTSLVKAISGDAPIRSGRVLVDGKDIRVLPPRERARSLAVVPQVRQLPVDVPVYQTVLLGRTPYINWLGMTGTADHAHVRRAMEQVQITELEKFPIGELSGGEQQRVLLSRALAQQTPILLVDEPTTHLDLQHQMSLLNLLKRLATFQPRSRAATRK